MRNWKKILTIVLDIALGVYLVFAITAFNKPDDAINICNQVTVDIADETTNGFITVEGIKELLEKNKLYPLEKPLKYVDDRKIEDLLKTSPFVNTAECYKTQEGSVFINITQRMPTVRVKAINGDDYYLDDKDCIMPNSNYTSDLIIATGYISRWFATNYISVLTKALTANPFWENQIEQIYILPDRGIELVPRVGHHIVYLGKLPFCNSKNKRQELIQAFVDKKMTRLEKFYKYGLSQAGWNKYSYINLDFDNQIICKKKVTSPGKPQSQV